MNNLKHSDTPHIQGSANKPYLSCKNVAAIQAELGSMSREEGTQFEKNLGTSVLPSPVISHNALKFFDTCTVN